MYPLLLKTLSHLPPHPTPQVDTDPLLEFPETYSKFPLVIYFTYGNASFHVTLSIHLTLSSLLIMLLNHQLLVQSVPSAQTKEMNHLAGSCMTCHRSLHLKRSISLVVEYPFLLPGINV